MANAVLRLGSLALAAGLMAACGPAAGPDTPAPRTPPAGTQPASDDPRVGLAPGLTDAGSAIEGLRLLSNTAPPSEFAGVTNSDLAFTGNYAIQGNYNGFIVWDISNPAQPRLVKGFVCPASQSDVSIYRNLLFVSGEGLGGRVDCGTEGVQAVASPDRLRGIRIFDVSDWSNPRYIGNVQTCRGSHTHSVLVDPDDTQNVYLYVSGSAPVRPAEELPGCVAEADDPESALFRIEVIRVPLAQPQTAAIVSSPRIFEGLTAPPEHGLAPADVREVEQARASGGYIININGQPYVLSDEQVEEILAQVVQQRGGTGAPTAQDSATLRAFLPQIEAQIMAGQDPDAGPTQCHDITLYPALGLAGGACEGYGFLLDISDPVNPTRITAVADSNFSYWHSATFNNAGDKLVFTDEWGGGGGPKCRVDDPMEWGANAIFTIRNRRTLEFESYYKLPAPQTPLENCVAHNGSIIPIPGRDVMVQGWYQGGISIFDFTDADDPVEIAFFDRGPVNPNRMVSGGSWSAYWYNGVIVSSEIARGLDILELTPSEHLTQNEIDAAKTVRLEYFNAQGQPKFVWPATYALARAYLDQLDRSNGLSDARISEIRQALAAAESSGTRSGLGALATSVEGDAASSSDAAKVRLLAAAIRGLAT